MKVDVVVLHIHDTIAWYENGELVFSRESEDFVDSLSELVGKHIVSLTHKYVTEKGFENHCDGEIPDKLNVFAIDELE